MEKVNVAVVGAVIMGEIHAQSVEQSAVNPGAPGL